MTSTLKDEPGEICTEANYSSEDGGAFLFHLEAIWGYFSAQVTTRPSMVDNFLAILPPNGEVTMYCNELSQIIHMRSKAELKTGQIVTKDDIAEINHVHFKTAEDETIEIPSDSGVVIIISHAWRKSLFYDFRPLTGPERSIDVGKLVGRQLAGMLFQEFYSIADENWDRMIDWGWFPFIGLSETDRRQIIGFSTRNEEAREIMKAVCENYLTKIADRLDSWRKKAILQEHVPFLESARERLLNDDFIACISILYPRIEGVMRGLALIANPAADTGQSKMVENLIANREESSLLLPSRFKKYLLKFYFRSFDFAKGELPLSRHTVGHGLSRATDYDLVNATTGFLIFEQLFYYL